jgi:SAM-dependent MidA family methyltransferase
MNRDRNFPGRSELLLSLVRDSIRERGPLSFAEYMQQVLYHPSLGYYASAESPIGPRGDYFTSVSATRLFGRMLARVLSNWRRELGEAPFSVYEFGAHHGQLRADVLNEIEDLKYQTFEFADPVPPRLRGCVLSNELLDALPFHRVKVVGGRWQELFVDATPQGLTFRPGPLSHPELEAQLAELPAHLMEGYETEVSLGALEWLRQVTTRLEAGFLLSIDYGHDTVEYFAPRRARGGLRCYYRHQLSDDPFQHLGEQDITADVNFGMLMAESERLGLQTVSFVDQSRFLLKNAGDLVREIVERDAGQFSRERNALRLLTHPSMLGGPFKVLVLRKFGASERLNRG